MKRRTILLGRGGTVLLSIGLALLLVSLIPSTQRGSFHSSNSIYHSWRILWRGSNLTPQQGLRISVTANDTLNVYLLEVDSIAITSWIREHYSGSIDWLNATYFDEFLEENPESVVWQKDTHDGRVEYEYNPTKITNATFIISNPGSKLVTYQYEFSIIGYVAPATKVRTLTQWIMPIGLLLALPQIVDLYKTRKKDRGSQLVSA
jgi:hypothetical protein